MSHLRARVSNWRRKTTTSCYFFLISLFFILKAVRPVSFPARFSIKVSIDHSARCGAAIKRNLEKFYYFWFLLLVASFVCSFRFQVRLGCKTGTFHFISQSSRPSISLLMNCSLDFFKLFSETVVAHLWHKISQVGNEELMTLQVTQFYRHFILTCRVEDNEPADLVLSAVVRLRARTGRPIKLDMMLFWCARISVDL